jgi:hypothetical protein
MYPIHPLQVVAMGMLVSDSLQLEDLAEACKEEARYEFMVVRLPLRPSRRHRLSLEPDRVLLKDGRARLCRGVLQTADPAEPRKPSPRSPGGVAD